MASDIHTSHGTAPASNAFDALPQHTQTRIARATLDAVTEFILNGGREALDLKIAELKAAGKLKD